MPESSKRSTRRTVQGTGELALIERIRREAGRGPRGGGQVRLGIGDDCAIVRPRAGEEIVVTTDFSLEGRHFRRDWHSPEAVGHRTLARGLSDLAAMGARPVAAFLSLALPASVARNRGWLDGFLHGMLNLAERVAVPLAGGDTSESPSDHVLADIVLLGAVAQGRAMRRDGARPGDRLYVTGALGGAAAELDEVGRGALSRVREADVGGAHPHLFPEPRLRAGQALVRRALATAAMDLSDGPSSDLQRMCEASDVGAEVEAEWLPLHPLLDGVDREKAMGFALHGGEDYELLFAARPGVRVPAKLGGVQVTEIGRVTERRRGAGRVVLVESTGRRRILKPAGWEHLR